LPIKIQEDIEKDATAYKKAHPGDVKGLFERFKFLVEQNEEVLRRRGELGKFYRNTER